jgi:hypothetical protein
VIHSDQKVFFLLLLLLLIACSDCLCALIVCACLPVLIVNQTGHAACALTMLRVLTRRGRESLEEPKTF